MRARTALVTVLALAVLVGCAGRETGTSTAVVQFIDIRNQSGEPVLVTARIDAGQEQQLGFLEPVAFRRFQLPTGAAATGEIVLRARNPQTGREAIERLQVAPGQTLEWVIRF